MPRKRRYVPEAVSAYLRDPETRHLRVCFPGIEYPEVEFWDLPEKTFEGVAAYKGEGMFLDPYTYHQMLMERVTRPSKWILRMSVCAHLYSGC